MDTLQGKLNYYFMKSLNKTEAPIFYLLCVLCLQRQSFLLLFHYGWCQLLCDGLKFS